MIAVGLEVFEDLEFAAPSKTGVLCCSDGSPEKGYDSVPLLRA